MHVEMTNQLGAPPRRVSCAAAARAARASASSRGRPCAESKREPRHEHVARAVGVDDRSWGRNRLPATLVTILREVVATVAPLGPDAQARPYSQVAQVVALAAVARGPGKDVDLYATRDDACEPARGRHDDARPPRGDQRAGIVARVEDAVELRQVVPVQRILDRGMVVHSMQQDGSLTARLGKGRDACLRPRAAPDAQVAAVATQHALRGLARRIATERRDEARLGAERRQRPRGHAAAARGLLERVVQLQDGAALERLVQAGMLDPLDVADDCDAGHARYLGLAPSPSSESTARNASCGTSTVPIDLHALLALLLLLEQLALARDVAAVALGQHVLALGLDRLARDDARADRGLDRHVEDLARDDACAAARRAPLPRRIGAVAVHDQAERVDRIAVAAGCRA